MLARVREGKGGKPARKHNAVGEERTGVYDGMNEESHKSDKKKEVYIIE